MIDNVYGAVKNVPDSVVIVDQFGTPITLGSGLTNAELRASPVQVSGPLTDTQLRALALAVTGPLTDTQLRAAALNIIAASLPLPTGAATEATLALLARTTDITTLINAAYSLSTAQIIPVATTTFTIMVDPKFPHTFLNVIPCNSGGTYTASATGTATITVESVNAPGVLQVPAEPTIPMSAPTDVSFGGNLLSIRGTVTGLTSTHYRVSASQNKA